jgi:hypothetical protein
MCYIHKNSMDSQLKMRDFNIISILISQSFALHEVKMIKHILFISVIITMTLLAGQIVYIAPHSGQRYHSTPACRGLRNAKRVKPVDISKVGGRTPCKICY